MSKENPLKTIWQIFSYQEVPRLSNFFAKKSGGIADMQKAVNLVNKFALFMYMLIICIFIRFLLLFPRQKVSSGYFIRFLYICGWGVTSAPPLQKSVTLTPERF